MSEDKLLNKEGLVETIEEVGYSRGNGIPKIVIVGALIAAGVATVVFIKKRRAKKAMLEQPIVNETVKTSKTEK